MPRPPPAPPPQMCFYPALPVPLGIEVATTPAHPCPYLPGRTSVSRGFRCQRVPGSIYQRLMDAGFRRSGRIFYQNACPGCRACTALRVPAWEFRPSESQRRVRRKNRDVSFSAGKPVPTDEKHALYVRYLAARHDGKMSAGREEFEDFLYHSPTDTLEVVFRGADGRLLGVGLCDLTPSALSSVYFYFSPDAPRRGLGIYSCLVEIDLVRSLRLEWYYPGFWVPGCSKMEYKSRLSPSELLGTDGLWRPFDPNAAGSVTG